jgi:uncharacterized membrane protein
MLAVTYYLTLFSYFSLLALCLIWHMVISPPTQLPVAFVLLVLTVPLLIFVRGLLRDNRRSFLFISILSLFYFALGISTLYSDLTQQMYAIGLTVLGLLLHLSSLFHVNALVRHLRRHALAERQE